MGDDVSLKEHIETRLIALEKATDLASRTLEKRLEGMNEFRAALKEQTSLFVTRTELNVQLDKIEIDLRILREYRAGLEAKASNLYVTITMLVAVIGCIASLIALIRGF